jgi:hypothetical protein
MAYTTINKSTDHFDIRTYSASGAGSISDVDFQPDFIWFKNRTIVGDHGLMDAVRGVNGIIHSNDTNAEVTSNGTTNITAFTSNGFTYGASYLIDTGAGTPCTWLWKANGTGSANTVGSINSTVSVNTTAGFSIVTYTGNGVSGATVGHGLGVAPKMIMVKCLNAGHDWAVFHKDLTSNNYFLVLNENIAQASGTTKWNDTDPSSTVFTLGTGGGVNANTQTHVAYCFADVQGYSKFGSYTGNGNTDGTFVYTGFAPKYIMVKDTTTVRNWHVFDTERDGYGKKTHDLKPNLSSTELSVDGVHWYDYLSNGFKVRMPTSNADYSDINASGNKYIYMAFAEAPLVGTNGVTAKAR